MTKHVETAGAGARPAVCPAAWAAALMMTTALVAAAGTPGSAAAQTRQPAPGQAAVPVAAGQRAFAIAPQALADGLTLFGQQSGWQVSVRDALIGGVATPGVSGTMTPDQALRRLLAGTGFAYSLAGGNTVLLHKLPASAEEGTLNLGPVTVDGVGEVARGPVQGYVATRSATGTKTDTPLIKTPQAVSVVTRQQIDDQNAGSVAQALRYSSGVFAEYRGSSNLHDEIFVRGFGYVPRMLDGLGYGGTSAGQVDPWLLERVEVLHGPSSMLYGQSNPGGIINLVSKRPTEKAQREVRVEVGNRGRLEGAFDFSGPVTEDGTLLYRVAGIGNRFDLEEDFSKQERLAIAPSLTWRPDDRTELTILTNYQYEPEAGYRNFLPTVGVVYPGSLGYGMIPRSFFVGDPDFQESWRRQGSIGYQFERRLDHGFTLRQNTRYTHLESEYNTLSLGVMRPDQLTLTRAASADRQSIDQFVIDNQVESRFTTGALEHTLLGGIDYRWTGTDQLIQRNPSAPTINWRNPVYRINAGPLATTNNQFQRASQVGFYVQDQIDWENLTVIGGGRYDRSRIHVNNRIGEASNRNDGAFSGRVGAVYAFDSGFAPYASYSTSFEPELSTGRPGSPSFEPTKGKQAELGVKYQPPGWNALFTAAVFDIKQSNVVTYDSRLGYNVQIGEVHSRGFEFEARGEITKELSLIGSYSYIDAEVAQTSVANTLGKTPARLPGQQASLWADYRVGDGPLGGLGIGGGVRYIGFSYGNAQNTYKVPSATLFDAMLSYELGKVDQRLDGATVQLNATNLADKEYVASCAGIDSCFAGSGRTVTVSLGYRW